MFYSPKMKKRHLKYGNFAYLRTVKMLLQFFIAAAVFLPFTASADITSDTNKINALNVQSLDLAYSDPQKGLEVVKQTIQLSRKAGFTKGEIMALIRRGIIYDVTFKPEKAIAAYGEALELSRKARYKKGEGSSLNNIGLIYMNQHDLSKAMDYFQQAHDIFTEIENDQMLGSISNNIGMIYEETNRPKQALEWYRKGLKHTSKASNLTESANLYASIADVFNSLEKYDSSAYYSRKAIDIYEQTDNFFYLGKSYNNLALTLGKLNQKKEAEAYFLKSLDISRKIGNKYMVVSSGFNLSRFYNLNKRFKEEGKLLEEIYPLLSGKEMTEIAYKVCLSLSSWHFHYGSADRGDKLMKEYIRCHLAYYDQVNAKNLSEVEEKYKAEKKEQENKLLKKENQLQQLAIRQNKQDKKIANLYWTSGLILLLLIALLVFLWFRRKNHQKALENQKAIFEATLAERKRISFDLHDNVGSQLSYVVNNLELLSQHSQNDVSPDAQRIERTFKMSQEAIDSLRDTVWALHNSAITVEILSAKLESFARKVIDTDETELRFQAKVLANKVISPEHTMHIFRIFQESVNNILKHAKATVIEVVFEETTDGKLILEILDNGKGIEQTESPEGHFGLKNMSDRARQIGASWRIGKRNEGGTRVHLEL